VSTIEMLLHNALKLFVKQTNTVTAIRQQIFNGDNDLTWDAILHGAIMDVARNIPCDDSKSNPCELRKSIWNNNKGEDKRSYQETREGPTNHRLCRYVTKQSKRSVVFMSSQNSTLN